MAEDSASQANDLEPVARSHFGELSEAERRLLRAAPKGEFATCGPNASDSDPANNPANANSWGSEREIRAEVIRWLCLDSEAVQKVDPRGLRIYAGKITGELDLSFASIVFPLILRRCRLCVDANLMYLKTPTLNLSGSRTQSILADGASVAGSVFLRSGFCSEGELRLLGVRIGSALDCSGSVFKNRGGNALSADSIEVGGEVSLEDVTFEGEVRLLDANLGRNLACNRSTFKNPGRIALNADRAKVRGSIFLRGALTEGGVRMLGAQIGSNLECDGGAFKSANAFAFNAERLHLGGGAFLRHGFIAEGIVRLIGAQIAGNLDCEGGTFQSPYGEVISAENANVGGHVFFRDGFRAEGAVTLHGAVIEGGLHCRSGLFGTLNLNTTIVKGILLWAGVQIAALTRLELRNASVGSIEDEEASWPQKGNLSLDGFAYARISKGPTGSEARLRWLDRVDQFTLQPYRQLAKVLRETGDERGARRVLFEMERRSRKEERDRPWYWRSWDWINEVTIGYGQKSGRALVGLTTLVLLGCLLFGCGYLGGALAPNEKEAYAVFEQRGYPPDYYPQFNPFIYSLEHSFPFVNLGMKDQWAPHQAGSPRLPVLHWRPLVSMQDAAFCGVHIFRLDAPSFLRLCLLLQVALGWMLATLFVAGFTGIVKAA